VNYDHPELQEKLAAEYVLGTLSGLARRRFVKLMRRNPQLQAAVATWEARLTPLAQAIKPVEPPVYVWKRIAARVGISEPAHLGRGGLPASFWDSLPFWRTFAIASGAAAFAFFLYIDTFTKVQRVQPPPSVVAILAGKEAKPVMLVAAEPRSGTLTVTVLSKETIATDRDFELWALPEGGSPKSLGLVASSGVTRLKLPADGLRSVPAVAISLEPKGGSPTGSPTGPVLYQGSVVRVGV
jgi:anti-sigma-K factor RskA